MKRKYIYISVEKTIEIHHHLVKGNKGLSGIKDIGQLESILTHIQNDDYYPKMFDKITHLVFCLSKFHVFSDGNKRTALAMGAYFLGLNYSNALAEKFMIEMENVIVDVASGKIKKNLLKDIIKSVFFEEENSEELLFEIYKALK